METTLSTFLPFTRLPQELRMKIWRLALARTIEQTWNNSKFQWEFNAEVPSILQAAYEARVACFNTESPTTLRVKGENLVDNIRPFDTLYVRRECQPSPFALTSRN